MATAYGNSHQLLRTMDKAVNRAQQIAERSRTMQETLRMRYEELDFKAQTLQNEVQRIKRKRGIE